ncbi:hypothetical protein FACS1894199_02950 [Bacteroidia bacterium]|nr:hypothetical protein FACS1894199_02950 [Bacteroidia bacterium]
MKKLFIFLVATLWATTVVMGQVHILHDGVDMLEYESFKRSPYISEISIEGTMLLNRTLNVGVINNSWTGDHSPFTPETYVDKPLYTSTTNSFARDRLSVGQHILVRYALYEQLNFVSSAHEEATFTCGKTTVYSLASSTTDGQHTNAAITPNAGQAIPITSNGYFIVTLTEAMIQAIVSNNGNLNLTVAVDFTNTYTRYDRGRDWLWASTNNNPYWILTSSSYQSLTMNTDTYVLNFSLSPEPTAITGIIPYKDQTQKTSGITVSGNNVTLTSCTDVNSLLLNFYDADAFDFYYDKATSSANINNEANSASINTNVSSPKGLVVRLDKPVAAGDVLTVTLKSKIAGRGDKTFTVNLSPGTFTNMLTFADAPGTSYCDGDTEWHFSRSDTWESSGYKLWSINNATPSPDNTLNADGTQSQANTYTISGSESYVNYTQSMGMCKNTQNIPAKTPFVVPALDPNDIFALTATGSTFCSNDAVWYFNAKDNIPYHITSIDNAVSVGTNLYRIPTSETEVKFTYIFNNNGCPASGTQTFATPFVVPKPLISASATSFCDDGSEYTGVVVTVTNAADYINIDYSPQPVIVTITDNGNNREEIIPPSGSVFVRSKYAASTIEVSAKVQSISGCVSVASDVLTITRYVAPKRPNLSSLTGQVVVQDGKYTFSYCGTETSTYVVHDNPQYGVQYWLWDVTSGAQLVKHKGANFWIFRDDQYDPKPGTTDINEDSYFDMGLSAGKYELRATHDMNSCTTVLPFDVINFESGIYDMSPTDAPVSVCNSELAGFDILDAFKDCELKTLLKNETTGFTFAWSVKLGSTALAAMPHPRWVHVDGVASGNYDIEFTVNNPSGCSKTYLSSVNITPRPQAFTIAADNSNVCDNAITVTASNASLAGLTYEWTLNDTVLAGNDRSSIFITNLKEGSNYITAKATNAGGCYITSNRIEVTRRVLRADVSFTAANIVYCSDAGIFSLKDLLTGADKDKIFARSEGFTYNLSSTPSGLSIDNSLPDTYMLNPTLSTAREYILSFEVFQTGCSVQKTAHLTINPIPAAFTISADNTGTICNSDNVTVTAGNSGVAGLTYKWFVNGTVVSGVSGATLGKTYLAEGANSIYTVAIVASSGCSVTSNTITVNLHTLNPTIAFSSASYSYCQNASGINLKDLLTGTDKAAVLDKTYGIGQDYSITSSPSGLNFNGSYDVTLASSTPQAYTLTLTVTRGGCSVTKTAQLIINPIPAAFTISADNTGIICNSDNVTVTAGNSGVAGLTYKWFVNGTEVSGVSGATLGKTYLAEGANSIYTVAIVASSGCSVTSNTITVNLHTLNPTIAFSSASYSYCQNASGINLKDLLTGTDKDAVLNKTYGIGQDYSITSSPSGLNFNGSYDVTLASSTPQAYTLTLTVTRGGCSVTKTAQLNVNSVPQNFTISTTKPSSVISGETVYLLCNSSAFDVATSALSNTASVDWYLGTTKVGSTATGSYNYTLASDQAGEVYATAVSSAGCSVNSNNKLNVDRRTVDFSGISVDTDPVAYCKGDNNVNYFIFVTASQKSDIEGGSAGWGYNLNAGGIIQSDANNSKNLTLNSTNPGTYNTVFTVSKNGCSTNYNKSITVKPVPGATTLAVNNANLCAGGTATMTATTTNYVSTYTYNWYKDGASSATSAGSSTTLSYSAENGKQTTTYKVAAVDNGCVGDFSNVVTINNNAPTLTAAFTANSFTSVIKVRLTNMVNVDASTISFTTKNLSTNAVNSQPATVSGDVYTINGWTGIGITNYEVIVTFSDDKLGTCSNTVTVGTITKNGSSYTVSGGSISPSFVTRSVSIHDTIYVYDYASGESSSSPDYDSEAERLYREYVKGLYNDEHLAFLAPTYTNRGEAVKLLIYSQSTEKVSVRVYSLDGSLVSSQSVDLKGGITEHWLQANDKPQSIGMYFVEVIYASGKRETLKGMIK